MDIRKWCADNDIIGSSAVVACEKLYKLLKDPKGSKGLRTEKEIRERLEELQADERLSYPPASVLINAPLALIQVAGNSQINLLKWVLGHR